MLKGNVLRSDPVIKATYQTFKKVTLDTTLEKLNRILDKEHFAIVVHAQRLCKYWGFTVWIRRPQHDELEPNLKKNPPQKRNMGFWSYSRVVRKNTNPCFRKWNHRTDEIFSIINEKKILNKVCSPYPLCLIKKDFG